MAARDYTSTPAADRLGLVEIIHGLAGDLRDLRAGKISPAEGHARAALAKQLFSGVRLYVTAVSRLESEAAPVEATIEDQGEG